HAQIQVGVFQAGGVGGKGRPFRQAADGAEPAQLRQAQHARVDARIHAKIVAAYYDAPPPLAHSRFAMRALLKQIGWFIAVGCAAAATHWLAAVACVELLGMPPLAANAAGWLIAFVVSFTGHYRLTFRHLASRWTIAGR